MGCCIPGYECEQRGCYGESVGMSQWCPGVKSRLASHEAGTCDCKPKEKQ